MKLKTEQYEDQGYRNCSNLLKEGKVVAFANVPFMDWHVFNDNEEALKALKACKIRPEEKPIPTMVSSFLPNGGNRNYERRSKRFSGRIYAWCVYDDFKEK